MYTESQYILDNVESYGYIMAQFYQSFVKWVETKREHHAKVSMRSGHPIMHAAKWLGERGKVKIDEWDEAWINRKTMEEIDRNCKEDINAKKYIRQENLDKPFSFVDNGYTGTIPTLLSLNNLNDDVQTLLLLGNSKFIPNAKKSVFIGQQMEANWCLKNIVPNFLLPAGHMIDIVENMPQGFEEYSAKNYINKDGKIVLDIKKNQGIHAECFDLYRKGMANGFEDCFSAVQSEDKVQFIAYIKALLETIITTNTMKNRDDHLKEQKDKIKEVYQKG